MERQPIRELQGYLRLLSEEYSRIPQLKRDGIFGPLTTEAVQEFQRQFEMEATGIVDFATWDQIFRCLSGCRSQKESGTLPVGFSDSESDFWTGGQRK